MDSSKVRCPAHLLIHFALFFYTVVVVVPRIYISYMSEVSAIFICFQAIYILLIVINIGNGRRDGK